MTNKILPNFESCQSCPQWDDVNGCWRDVGDVCECLFVDIEELEFDGDKYDNAQPNPPQAEQKRKGE